MKISSANSPKFAVILEAENQEEANYLYDFFTKDCKRIAKKYPLKNEKWKGHNFSVFIEEALSK